MGYITYNESSGIIKLEKETDVGRRQNGRKQRGCVTAFLSIILAIGCVLLIGIQGMSWISRIPWGQMEAWIQKLPWTQEITEQSEVKEEQETVPFQKVTVHEGSLEDKFYYQQLSENEKSCYKEILQGVKDEAEEIYVHSSDADRVNQLFLYIIKDFPELFWCDGSGSASAYRNEGYTILTPVYAGTPQERQQRRAQIEAKVNECLEGISYAASDYEKILYVYEYIVDTVEYDETAAENQNIYSVFVGGRSVCAGYARATQYLLEQLGVFCTYVTGTVEGSGSHAWNLVRCEGEYYYVDTTWGDPVYRQAEGTDVPEWENINYDYMCCGDSEIFKTHTLDDGIEVPACTNIKWNYYVVNGMYYDSYDEETILNAMNEVIGSKGNPVTLKFASEEVYEQAKDGVLNDLVGRAAQNLCRMYGLMQAEYYYQDNPELCKITIYWKYE
ncbi:hypothetical protein OCV99_13110 [Dorea acetigenes]|uniref:Transglutaminase-like domain-containing protein n=1 Tax=Dorea acetigenes TaxID=2981787 RepID=A0ABT2RPV7_9FIRM|nr:transglutaminase domain-containing protein [Dorea acetigenes]MCU6687458.1 hypothetical protein [Dorea acetigenes]SCJ43117.1 Uncharacterized protein involved in cytokinesis%2C contains TGc (transglutaminase/protease-like) domain [uncultured Clostridium sp.]